MILLPSYVLSFGLPFYMEDPINSHLWPIKPKGKASGAAYLIPFEQNGTGMVNAAYWNAAGVLSDEDNHPTIISIILKPICFR